MYDFAIRSLLQKTELLQYIDDPNSKVVDELKLPITKSIIDIAVINGHLHGYEIKSASDTLQRLPNQLVAYEKIFDFITVVTEKKHYNKIYNVIPDWVGIGLCYATDGQRAFELLRPPVFNNNKEGFFIAKLLWHEELISILSEFKVPFKKNMRNWILCETLAKHLDTDSLCNVVRQQLKKRKNWKTKECYEAT